MCQNGQIRGSKSSLVLKSFGSSSSLRGVGKRFSNYNNLESYILRTYSKKVLRGYTGYQVKVDHCSEELVTRSQHLHYRHLRAKF